MGARPLAPTQATQLDQATKRAIDQVYIELNRTRGDLQTLAASHVKLKGEVTNSQSQARQNQQQISSLPSFDVLQSGRSTQLKMQSSVLPAHCTGFVFVATSTSVTFYWDGTNGSSQITIAWPDGTSTLVPLGAIAVNGLTPGTQYYFYASFNTQTNAVVFSPLGGPNGVPDGDGTPAVAYTATNIFAAAAADGDSMQSLSDGPMTVTTPSSGMTTSAIGGK